jgi:hypothetical protein
MDVADLRTNYVECWYKKWAIVLLLSTHSAVVMLTWDRKYTQAIAALWWTYGKWKKPTKLPSENRQQTLTATESLEAE